MSSTIIIFSILLAIIATITKIIGCGLGAKICKYTNRESIQIGMGMISRGEVALIVATKGAALGLLSNTLLGPVIITVVVTTIISPILLKLVFRSKSGDDDSREESQLAKGYEKVLDYTTTERNS